jgi:hypothetical protein
MQAIGQVSQSVTPWGLIALDYSQKTNEIISILSFEISKSDLPWDFPTFNMDYSVHVYENKVRVWRADNLSLATELVSKHL